MEAQSQAHALFPQKKKEAKDKETRDPKCDTVQKRDRMQLGVSSHTYLLTCHLHLPVHTLHMAGL